MEYSDITYDDYFTLNFSQRCFGTFFSLMGIGFRGSRVQTIKCLIIVALTYMLLYTILFSTLWGAATGYVSLPGRAYRMPDNSFANLESERLSICWSIDGHRLGLRTRYLVDGPDFSTLMPELEQSYNPNQNRNPSTTDIGFGR